MVSQLTVSLQGQNMPKILVTCNLAAVDSVRYGLRQGRVVIYGVAGI